VVEVSLDEDSLDAEVELDLEVSLDAEVGLDQVDLDFEVDGRCGRGQDC